MRYVGSEVTLQLDLDLCTGAIPKVNDW